VMFRVSLGIHQFKILNSVILLVTVFVVNEFKPTQLSTEVLFHDKTVLIYALTVNLFSYIRIFH